MPRNKRVHSRVKAQCLSASKSIDRALDHLMAADVLAKGGTIDGHGKVLPAGIDPVNPEKEGHPVLNEWLPVLVTILTSAKDAILKMRVQL